MLRQQAVGFKKGAGSASTFFAGTIVSGQRNLFVQRPSMGQESFCLVIFSHSSTIFTTSSLSRKGFFGEVPYATPPNAKQWSTWGVGHTCRLAEKGVRRLRAEQNVDHTSNENRSRGSPDKLRSKRTAKLHRQSAFSLREARGQNLHHIIFPPNKRTSITAMVSVPLLRKICTAKPNNKNKKE